MDQLELSSALAQSESGARAARLRAPHTQQYTLLTNCEDGTASRLSL